MNPIEEIIEKIKKEYRENGGYSALKHWYETYHNNETEAYNKIYGFLWGLSATDYISDNEFEKAVDYLINIDRQKGESL